MQNEEWVLKWENWAEMEIVGSEILKTQKEVLNNRLVAADKKKNQGRLR